MIKNKTKNKTLVTDYKLCKSDLSKGIGLMFSRKKADFGLIFPFRKEKIVPLHMFFVFYPIDVLFLSSNKKVVDMKQGFKPFTIYTSKKRVKYVIELPVKTIDMTDTLLNDVIAF